MRPMMFFAGAATLAAAVAVGAQASNATGMGPMDQMSMAKAYVGCLAHTSDGHYTLTDASAAGKKPEMAMGKDDMGTAKDTMAKQAMGAMSKDAMMPLTLGLTSEKVDLSKHVGHQVSVAGTDAQPMGKMAMFTVTSLTMVANTCAKGSGR